MASLLRKAAGLVLILLALPIVVVLFGVAVLQVPAVERELAERIAVATAGRVRVDGLSVHWPLDLAADRLVLADAEGPWLVATQVRLDWAPTALARGWVDISRVAAEQVAVLRRPMAEPTAEPAQPARIPELPLALRVARLDTVIELAPAVAGEAATLRLTGDATLAAGVARLRLDAAPFAHLALDYSQPAQHLAIDVDVDAAGGALMLHLAGLTGLPPLALRIQGEGPLADWQGRLAASAGGQTCVGAEAGLSRTARGALRLAGTLRAEPACLGLADLAAILPGGLTGEARMVLGEDGVAIEQARLSGATLAATAQGHVGGGALDLAVTAALPDLAVLQDLARLPLAGAVSLDGRIAGTFATAQLDVTVRSPGGSAAELAWTDLAAAVSAGGDGQRWTVATSGRLTLPSRPELALAGPVRWQGHGTASAEGQLALPWLSVTAPGLRLGAFGSATDWGRDTRLQLSARATDLARLAAAPPGLAGSGVLEMAVRGDLGAGALSFAVAGSTAGLRTGVARLDQVLGASPRLALSGRTGAGQATIAAARLAGRAVTARAAGRMGAALALGWRIDLADLAGLAPDLAGRAGAGGMVAGAIAAPRLAGQVTVEGRRGAIPFALAADLALARLAEPAGVIAATLRSQGREARLRSRFAVAEAIRLTDLVLTSGPGRIAGDLAIDPAGPTVTGRIAGNSGDLAGWSALAGLPLGGAVSLDAMLAQGRGQELRLRLAGRDLMVGETRIGTAALQAELTQLLTAPRGSLRAEAGAVVAGGVTVTEAQLRAEGDTGQLSVSLRASGAAAKPLALTAEGSARFDAETALRLTGLQGRYGPLRLDLAEPTTLVLAADGLRLEPLALRVGKGRVTVAGSKTGERVSARLRVDDLPADLAEAFLPGQRLVGTIAGSASLDGTLRDPVVDAEFRVSRFAFAESIAGAVPVDGSARAAWRGGRLTLTGEIAGGERVSARLDATLPLVAGPEGVSLPAAEPVSGRLRLRGDVERLAELLPLAGQRVAGRLSADLTLAGTVGEPAVDGQAEIVEGIYENYVTGTVIRRLGLTVRAADSRHFTLSLRGSDGGKGVIAGEGTVELPPGGGVRFVADGRVNDFLAVQLDKTTARASGALRFEGDDTAAALTGQVRVERAEYDLTERLPSGVVKLDVIEINRPGAPPPRKPRRERAARPATEDAFTVALSITVEAQHVFVRGRGLDAELRGDLVIGGTISDPQVNGELKVARGGYDLLGRTFKIAEGRIEFTGQPLPSLDIRAEARARDLTAIVAVTGPATRPDIAFSSTPAYPPDEILSRLLFGREAGKLNVAQQLQLARAAAALAGGGGGFDPIGSIRGALGLDLLEVGGGGEGEGAGGPSVAVGKYVGDDTFVRVEQGTEGSAVSVEREFGRGFTVETEMNQRTGPSIGLNWRMDY